MMEITDTQRLDWLERTQSLVNVSDKGPHVCYGGVDASNATAHTFGKDYREAIDQAIWLWSQIPV